MFFVWEMLRPLLQGATLVIVPDDVIYDPESLAHFIEEHGVTRMLFTPSLLQAMLDTPSLTTERLERVLHRFCVLILCGEVVTSELRRRILNLSPPDMKLINLYSISECHDVSMVDLASQKPPAGKYCDTGPLIPGVEVMVMKNMHNVVDQPGSSAKRYQNLEPLPTGVAGQIFISGPTLAREYLSKPELTRERFIPRPEGISLRLQSQGQNESSAYARLYNSGDWGRMRPDGTLEILGRHNSMQKIRGYSIETRAVEVEILNFDTVSSCAVHIVGEEGTDKHLVAFVKFDPLTEAKRKVRELRSFLKDRLSHYMVPSFIVCVPHLPTHPVSGKLDSNSLPATLPDLLTFLRLSSDALGENLNAYQVVSDTEAAVLEAWSQVLRIPADLIDPEESFFDQGGHSLLASQLVASINAARPDFQMSHTTLFDNPTIRQLSRIIDGEVEAPTAVSINQTQDEISLFVKGIPSGFEIALQAFWHGSLLRHQRYDRVVEGPTQQNLALNLGSGSLSGSVILLTGSTGFFGRMVLHELLRREEGPSMIFCLVRASTFSTPLERIVESMKNSGLWQEKSNWHMRLEAIEGDMQVAQFGLRNEQYRYLATSVDHVFHCGARVNLVYPYQGLRRDNVISTAQILHFAMDTKVKFVTHVSTNAVLLRDRELVEEGAKLSPSELSSGYAQSKCVAEMLVRKAISLGVPACIIRPGNLGGVHPHATQRTHKHTASDSMISRQSRGDATLEVKASVERTSPVSSELMLKIERLGWNPRDSNLLVLLGCAILKEVPHIPGWHLELTPVNFAADAAVCIAADSSHVGKTFNLVNNARLSMSQIIQVFSRLGIDVVEVPFEHFVTTLRKNVGDQSASSSSPNVEVLKLLFQILDLNNQGLSLSENDVFDQPNVSSLFSRFPHLVEYPPFDERLCELYIKEFIASGILKEPTNQTEHALRGKTALVTGASGGIGAAIARALARHGADVCLVARRFEQIDSLASQLRDAFNVHAIAVCADVSDREAIQRCHRQAVRELGPVDILVNNAGVMHYTLMKNLHEDEWNEAIDVNCKGTLNCIAAVLPGMLNANYGHIVNISSDAGRTAFPGLAVYSGTKFFVEGLSEGLRKETVGSGLKVTTIQPGDCRTDIPKCTSDEEARRLFAQTSSARNFWLQAEDVAQAVLWAVSRPENVSVNELRVQPRDSPT